jgi:hypothetical protein
MSVRVALREDSSHDPTIEDAAGRLDDAEAAKGQWMRLRISLLSNCSILSYSLTEYV